MTEQVREPEKDLIGDEEAMLRLLNSAAVESGVVRDRMREPDFAADLAHELGGTGSQPEIEALVQVRASLQAATRAGAPTPELDDALEGIVQRARPLTARGLDWVVDGPAERMAVARAVIAWAGLTSRLPGRLRPCGNDECELFFLDRSKSNTARWCSMAVCGNRMKARRHHARQAGSRTR